MKKKDEEKSLHYGLFKDNHHESIVHQEKVVNQ